MLILIELADNINIVFELDLQMLEVLHRNKIGRIKSFKLIQKSVKLKMKAKR